MGEIGAAPSRTRHNRRQDRGPIIGAAEVGIPSTRSTSRQRADLSVNDLVDDVGILGDIVGINH